MKKLVMLSMIAIFVFAGLAFASEGKKCGMKDRKGCCAAMHLEKAEYKVEKTKMGVKIIIMSKDKKTIKEIQKLATECPMFNKDHKMNGYDMKGHDMKGHKNMSSDEKGYFTCPVMGTKMKIADAHSSYEYKGKTYYFCCGGCPDQFKANPEKYIKK